jgi:transposase
MNSIQLFQMALGIDSPWEIKKINFINNNTDLQELHIDIDFKSGSKFPDENGKLCSIHDTKKKTWRHLNFFQHSCYLHCRVPRIKCNDGCVKLIAVPWARPGSGFTLLFEAYAMALIEKEMPIKKVGELLSENPHRVWTIFNYWIKKAYAADDVTTIKDLGLDETSLRKGHDYITVAVDLEKRRVFHVAEGKESTVKNIQYI